jgi:hypothetical protein
MVFIRSAANVQVLMCQRKSAFVPTHQQNTNAKKEIIVVVYLLITQHGTRPPLIPTTSHLQRQNLIAAPELAADVTY